MKYYNWIDFKVSKVLNIFALISNALMKVEEEGAMKACALKSVRELESQLEAEKEARNKAEKRLSYH